MNKLNIGNKVNSSRFRKGKTDTSSFLTAEDWNAAIKAINDCIDAINNLPEHLPLQESSTNNKIDELESNLRGLNTRLVGVEASLNNLTPIQTGDDEISIAENDPIFTAWANGFFKDFFKFNGSNPESISSLNFGNGFVVNTTASTTTVSVDPSIIPSGSGANPADIATLSSKIETLTNNVNTLTGDVNTLSNSVSTLSGRVSALETATPSTDNTQLGGETPSTGGDSGTQSGDDNPPSGGGDNTGGSDTPTGGDTPSTGGDTPSTGGDTGGSGSEQGLTSNDPQIDTVNGYWIRKGSGGLPDLVIDSLSYSSADVDQYDIRFVYPTGNWSDDLINVYGLYQGFNSAINDYSKYNPFNGDTMSFNKYTGRLYLMESIPSPSPKDGKIEVSVTVGTKTTKKLTITVSKSTFGWSWSSNSGTIDVVNNIASENLPTLSGTNIGRARVKYSLQNVTPTGCVSLQNTSWLDVVSGVVPQPQINVNESGTATVRAEFGPTTVYNSVSPETYNLIVTKLSSPSNDDTY